MPRARGINPAARQRISQDIQAAKIEASRPRPATSTIPPWAVSTSQTYASLKSDYGPWFYASGMSSRVEAYRYDYMNRSVQIRWKNRITARSGPSGGGSRPMTQYGRVAGGTDIDYETFRRFARSASLGTAVNTLMNGLGYGPSSSAEDDAPSNANRSGGSRFRGTRNTPQNYSWP